MSIKREDGTCLKEIMENTPPIPHNCQWVTFLRNHDELTLGLPSTPPSPMYNR